MRRREFISLLGGVGATWPLAARAQQGERMRRIGVLVGSGVDADDSDLRARFDGFQHALQQLGWTDGRNVQIDYRFASGDPDRLRKYAAELVALVPDVILAGGAASVPPNVASNPHRADRVHQCRRSGRRWLRRQHGTARRQRDRLHHVGVQPDREMA
jgi:hypothetical protein